MSFNTLRYEVDAGIARLTLNRPDKLNSFTGEMHAELRSALDQVQDDPAVRVLVKGITKPNAMTVPERAVSQGPSGTFVYVVDEQGMARMRPVTTAHTAAGRWVVDSGIAAGDRVIVEGLPKVRPNTPVKVVAAAQPQQ